MQLKRLTIELEQWGDNKGKYLATIEYINPKGETKLILTPEVSGELLKTAGPMLNKFALNQMADLQLAIQGATADVTAHPQ